MPGFASYQSLAQATQDGHVDEFGWSKVVAAPQGAGAWYSLWKAAGVPTAGADPAATPGIAYVNEPGAITFPNVASLRRFVSQMRISASSQSGTSVMVYDRLTGVGSVPINSIGNKTVNSVALPRYTDGRDVQVWLEAPTALSVNLNTVFSLSSYTNQNGVSGRVGSNIVPPFATLPAGSLIGPMPLETGDLGVRSVEVGLSIAGVIPASGAVNVILIRPLLYLPWVSSPNERDLVLMTTLLPRVYDGASLGLAFLSGSTAAGNIMGTLSTVWG